MITLKQIRYFIAVADSGQFLKASLDLNVSQSAITISIKKLEETLSTKLLIRYSQGVELTIEGSKFLKQAKNIMASIDDVMGLVQEDRLRPSGKINLAIAYTVAGYFFPAYYNEFSRLYPNIKIKLVENERQIIEGKIIAGEADLALILTSNLENQEDLFQIKLLTSRRRLWVSSKHKFIGNQPISLQDISKEPYIMLDVDEASNTAFRYWNKTLYKPNIIFKTTSVEAVRSMVANDIGVTILSDIVYRPWSLEGKHIDVVSIAEKIPNMDIGIVWWKNRERTKSEIAFCDYMQTATSKLIDSLHRPIRRF